MYSACVLQPGVLCVLSAGAPGSKSCTDAPVVFAWLKGSSLRSMSCMARFDMVAELWATHGLWLLRPAVGNGRGGLRAAAFLALLAASCTTSMASSAPPLPSSSVAPTPMTTRPLPLQGATAAGRGARAQPGHPHTHVHIYSHSPDMSNGDLATAVGVPPRSEARSPPDLRAAAGVPPQLPQGRAPVAGSRGGANVCIPTVVHVIVAKVRAVALLMGTILTTNSLGSVSHILGYCGARPQAVSTDGPQLG